MTITTNTIAPGHEPISGYVLEELIGRGGYGEVWRAAAPGGMKKAIKFVYGNMGEKRTEQELKSLERIKGVQHPFILGLERFEAIDNQLVVVTELADGSLEDLVRQHRDRGSCGIPRATLLSYMRDVADALDYLHQLYKLQHLDIKPANLLMVGGRVKVADFGLLKDLQEVECSVVGGLTPIYAPPEVFDGKPSVHSDQYSMAVMYQELLTGTRPFTGRTIAQLATQHVHNAPNLSPLPPSDRPVVARALEKSFDRRYGTCSDFVEALTRPHGSTTNGSNGTGELDNTDTKTVSGSFVAGVGETNVSDLPQLDSSAAQGDSVATRHSLVIALGGTGAECMDDLFCRISSGDSNVVPTLHTVFLDTDESSVRSVRRFPESIHMPMIQSVNLPLRTPNEYRDGGMSNLRSMSRRWIYNVPRSGRTEGMRPLGRLALVDNWERVKRVLQEAIESVKKASGEEIPSIYVVGSLAGGSGSGMYLDIVHVLRRMLDDARMEQTSILSLLATCSLESAPSHPLELHDSLAALKEIEHFLRPGNSYPGDTHVDMPTLPSARSPMNNVYVVAADQSATGTPPSKTIADYLWFDATVGGELLENARRCHGEHCDTIPHGWVRSVGIQSLTNHKSFAESILAPIATHTLLARWIGNPADAELDAEKIVKRIQDRCKIDAQSFYKSAIGQFGDSEESRQQALVDFLKQMPVHELSDSTLVTSSLKAEFAERVSAQHVDSDIQSIVDTIIRELRSQLRQGRASVISAIEAIRSLSRSVRQWERNLRHESQILLPSRGTEFQMTADCSEVSMARLPFVQLACHVGEVLMESHAKNVASGRADALCRNLSVIESNLSAAATLLADSIRLTGASSDQQANPWDASHSPIVRKVEPCLTDLHVCAAKPWLVNLVLTTQHIKSPAALVTTINQLAVPLVKRAYDEGAEAALNNTYPMGTESLDITQSTSILSESMSHSHLVALPVAPEAPDVDVDDPGNCVRSLENVRPKLLTCGGQQRLILVAGTQSELDAFRSEIEEVHDGAMTCVVIESASPTLIHEAQQIATKDVISRLSTLTGSQTQVSNRLLTRCDIPWAGTK